jgi:hypothetical protein
MPPIDTLFGFTTELAELLIAEKQVWIHRGFHVADQKVQLEMDRWQADIENRRAEIQMRMLQIASQN